MIYATTLSAPTPPVTHAPTTAETEPIRGPGEGAQVVDPRSAGSKQPPPRNAIAGGARTSTLRAATALVLAAAPLAGADARAALPVAAWQPNAKGPTYPDPIWANPFGHVLPKTLEQALDDPTCWPYAKNTPQEGRHNPGASQGLDLEPQEISCENVVLGMRLEGARDPRVAAGCDSACDEGEHLVHLRIAPRAALLEVGMPRDNPLAGDFHFWRRDAETSAGRFSHKPGMGLPSHLDGSGRPIDCPERSDLRVPPTMAKYSEDCGYFCVEGPRPEPATEPPGRPQEPTGRLPAMAIAGSAAAMLGGAALLAYQRLRPASASKEAPVLSTQERGVLDRLGEGAALSQSALKKSLKGVKLPDLKAALQSLNERGLVESVAIDGVQKHRLTEAGRNLAGRR